MNSIGVDFKLKNIDQEGQKIKLQIVNYNFNFNTIILFSGTLLVKKDLELLLPVIIKELRRL